MKPGNIYLYNFVFIVKFIKESSNNDINFMIQVAMLCIMIYINNKYIDHTRFGYLYLIIWSKVNGKYFI